MYHIQRWQYTPYCEWFPLYTVNTINHTLYNVRCALYIAYGLMCTVLPFQIFLYILMWIIIFTHCMLYTAYVYSVYNVYYTLYSLYTYNNLHDIYYFPYILYKRISRRIMYDVQCTCTSYTVRRTIYLLHCVHSTTYIVHRTLYVVQYKVFVQCMKCSWYSISLCI